MEETDNCYVIGGKEGGGGLKNCVGTESSGIIGRRVVPDKR